MKKNSGLKKTMVMLLVVATLLSITTGCGQAKPVLQTDNSAKPQVDNTATPAQKTGNFVLDYVSKKKDGFVLGVVDGFSNQYMSQYDAGVKSVVEEYKKQGIIKDVIMKSAPTGSPEEEIAIIESMINSGVDGLLIQPVSSNSLTPVLTKAVAKGIVVISQSPEMTPNTLDVIIDTNVGAVIHSTWLAETLNGKGNILEITGPAGNSMNESRITASKVVFAKYPGIKIIDSKPGNWDPAQAQQVMATFLSVHKDFDAVFAQDSMQAGIFQAFKAANRKPTILTGDMNYGFFRTWKNEYPDMKSVDAVMNPGAGADALKILVRILQGQKLKPEKLENNPLQPGLKNLINIAPAYVITKEGDPNAVWMKNINPIIQAISLDNVLKLGEGQPDGAYPDKIWTEAEVDAFFVK